MRASPRVCASASFSNGVHNNLPIALTRTCHRSRMGTALGLPASVPAPVVTRLLGMHCLQHHQRAHAGGAPLRRPARTEPLFPASASTRQVLKGSAMTQGALCAQVHVQLPPLRVCVAASLLHAWHGPSSIQQALRGSCLQKHRRAMLKPTYSAAMHELRSTRKNSQWQSTYACRTTAAGPQPPCTWPPTPSKLRSACDSMRRACYAWRCRSVTCNM